MNNTVTIFIPVSRDQHLERLFHALEVLECDATQTNLLTYVDGNADLFVRTRNLTEQSKFVNRLCVHRPTERNKPQHGMYERRKRISAIKNESKALIGACDFVFGLEDDTIPPRSALAKLLIGYAAYPYAGFIEGVELGRWGTPYVGAWHADNVYEPHKIESMLPPDSVSYANFEEIDAGGFYCYLTKRENYMLADYKPFGRNDLGPDVEFGLMLRQQGLKNYIDWSISCEHRLKGGGVLTPGLTHVKQASMVKEDDHWKQVIARIA